MHGPQLFFLSIRAYSYVKREALKIYYFRRLLLCCGNVRGGLCLHNGFHFIRDGQK
jgi:hypothetical protein